VSEDLKRWTVEIPGLGGPVTVFAPTAADAMDEACALYHFNDVPAGTTACTACGREFECSSAT
jgi:hypothetical protein